MNIMKHYLIALTIVLGSNIALAIVLYNLVIAS